jgi:multiple sugar transport system permease protein
MAFTLFTALAASSAPKETRLVVWGPIFTDRTKGWDRAFAEFEKNHPGVKIRMLSMGVGSMNPQKLITAIVGKVPPDVVLQGRFTIADWAARDTFIPLDDYIKRDRDSLYAIKPEEYFPAAWNEAVYKGKCYGIPIDVDDRILYYNKALFREAGLDPNKPPKTWDELQSYAKKLTAYNKDGSFKRLGFIPNFGNAWLPLYSYENGGEFLSSDGRKCVMNNPQTVQALDWMVKNYDQFKGAEAIDSFQSGFKWDAMDPFLNGQIAMKVDVGMYLWLITRYNPGMDFGVAPPPSPTARYEGKGMFKGKPRYQTWSGGFAWVIPRYAKHPDLGWEFIKWITSEQGVRMIDSTQRDYNKSLGRPYVPYTSANTRVCKKMFDEFMPHIPKVRDAMQLAIDMMSVSRFRPVTPVGQVLWDEHSRAMDFAIHHSSSHMTAQQALDAGTKTVQEALDEFYTRERYPILNWLYPIGILAILVIGFVVYLLFKRRGKAGMGRLAKEETLAGFIFASPWIIGFLVFTAGPIIASFIFSFCAYDVLHPARWVGLENYHGLVTTQWYFMSKAMYNVAYLALFGISLGITVSLSIAMLLNTKIRGMRWYRTVFYLPAIMPGVANAILWIWVLNPQYGLINAAWRATLTSWFHIAAPLWLNSPITSKPALIVMGLWGAGGGMILWLAGLQGIPQHLYEAASLDGAGWWSKLRNVTLPMLTPYIFFNLIMGTIGALQAFEAQYIMTGGGPTDSTLVPVLYLFNKAFADFKMGYASAVAWMLFVIIIALTLVQFKLASRWVYYESESKG